MKHEQFKAIATDRDALGEQSLPEGHKGKSPYGGSG